MTKWSQIIVEMRLFGSFFIFGKGIGMAINCENCKFYDVDYVWDDECEDEVEEESCTKDHWDELENEGIECPYFQKQKQYRYVEESTKCDHCEFKGDCNLINTTTLDDATRHYMPALNNVCKLEIS